MKQTIAWCSLAALLATSCRREAPPAGTNPSVPPRSTASASSGPTASKGVFTPAPAVPADSPAAKAHNEIDQKLASGNVQLQVQVLDELLQAWVMSNNSVPKDLEELVRAKMLVKLPTPPPGKRFAVDQKAARVVLVGQ